MKYNKIILSVFATLATFAACDENKMEWVDSDSRVSVSDIPLEIEEKIANYDYIKSYAATYHPEITVGGGIGADLYLSDDTYKKVADENYQLYTLGNAMKHGVVVSNSGNLDFTTIDNFLAAAPSDMKVYGHNFIWHTQQNQTYLKSLIAPSMVVDSSSGVANVLSGDDSNFDGGTTGGWGSWGSSKDDVWVEDGAGEDGTACVVLKNTGDGNAWDAQFAYTFSYYLDMETTYVIKFKAKSSTSAGQLQFQYQNSTTYSSQGGYNTFSVGTEWTEFEYEFTPAYDDVDRIIFNFGAVGGTYYIDDIEFGAKAEETMYNVLSGDDSTFDEGTTGSWGSWGSGKDDVSVVDGEGPDGSACVALTNTGDGNAWDAQFAYTFDDYLTDGTIYQIKFSAKSSIAGGQLQFQYQNGSTYGSQGGYNTFTIGTDWIDYEYEFTVAYDDVNRIILNFGAVGGTYYVDNIQFGEKIDQTASSKASKAPRKAGVTYVAKTAEEKKDALLGAMEDWISGMCSHIYDDGRFVAWDVINEPIMDGGGWRGIDGFGGSDDDGVADSEPTETEEDGLNLNWSSSTGNQHFYWGYYLGKDYACKAFEFAHQYAPSNVKLFVNDYNLETSPTKLADLISFVDYIDQNNATGADIVDGIGTQMHLTASSITEDEIDTMFKTLAATGKLIRVTELDVALGTSSPSSDQLELQAEVYQMVFDSYFENVPEAQRSGITIWSLSDNANEHEYWLNGDCPNLFDANYERKWAYKGVCDGIAGYDVSTDFTGEDWVNAYTTDDEEEDETSSEE